MASVNKVILIGNLTRDPELRYTPKGTAVCTIGLAVNRKYKVGDETREEVTFIDISAWGGQGETLQKYLKKGAPLYVEGRLRLEQWEDKDTGKNRSRLTVICESFQFLGQGGGQRQASDDDPAAHPTARNYSSQSTNPPTQTGPADGPPIEDEDDIPF